MINFAQTRIDRSTSRAVAPSVMVLAEGLALVADLTVPGGVAPSAASASEQFVGVSLSQQRTLTAFPNVEEFAIPATPFQVTLARTPLGGTLHVAQINADGSQAAAYASNGAPATGQFLLTGAVLLFAAADVGKTVRVRYRFAPSAAQAQMLQGDVLPGGDSGAILNSVGVIIAGDVATSEFDTAANWGAAAPVVTTGANGLFTIAGTGPAVPNCRVIERPSVVNPFLVLSLQNG